MDYKDLIGITFEDNSAIAYIPNVKQSEFADNDLLSDNSLYIYNFLSNNSAICGFKNGAREIYDIKTIDNEDWICMTNGNNLKRVAPLKDMEYCFCLVGKIENNIVYDDFYGQGNIYKNELVYLNTKDLSKEEIDKLPLKDKICYIPEVTFKTSSQIELNDTLKDGYDYYTVLGIEQDIKNYFGEEIIQKLNKEQMKNMIEDVFYCVDWQYPSSLLEVDHYLDGYIEELESQNDKLREFIEIYTSLKEKPIGKLSMKEIGKFLILDEELDWINNNLGEDKNKFSYDKELLDELSNEFVNKIHEMINGDLLYNNDLHKSLDDDYVI